MSTILDLRRGLRTKRDDHKRPRGAEAIEVRERRHGYFPKSFIWRGRRYDVYAVERCWTVSRGNGGKRGTGHAVERHYFRVRCAEGTFEVYQDVRHNTWHLQRQVSP